MTAKKLRLSDLEFALRQPLDPEPACKGIVHSLRPTGRPTPRLTEWEEKFLAKRGFKLIPSDSDKHRR